IVVAGIAVAGIAYAENQPPDPSVAVTKAAATGAPAPAAAGGRAGILKGAIHGDLLVRGKDGSTHTVTFDPGKVSPISVSSIPIQRPASGRGRASRAGRGRLRPAPPPGRSAARTAPPAARPRWLMTVRRRSSRDGTNPASPAFT